MGCFMKVIWTLLNRLRSFLCNFSINIVHVHFDLYVVVQLTQKDTNLPWSFWTKHPASVSASSINALLLKDIGHKIIINYIKLNDINYNKMIRNEKVKCAQVHQNRSTVYLKVELLGTSSQYKQMQLCVMYLAAALSVMLGYIGLLVCLYFVK